MTASPSFDLAVVGLGAMGAAVAFQAARQGMTVVGIDQFDPPHTMGSTHAETRISRLAVGEGSQYLPFVARSHDLWRELEAVSGVPLLHQCGGLIVTEPEQTGGRWADFVVATADVAEKAGIEFERMTPAEAGAAHPSIRVPSSNSVGYEPTAGLVMNERAVTVQIAQARQLGATIRTHERVIGVAVRDHDIRLTTDAGVIDAQHVVLAAGPWLPGLVGRELSERLVVTRQTVFWFEADDLDAFSTDRHPFVMWVGRTNEDYFAVFPRPPGTTPAVKVLGEQFVEVTSPDRVDRSVSEAEQQEFHERFIARYVSGVSSRCVRAEVCLYTNTPDDHFLIDTDQRSDRITLMSPCSGHGFKHSAALGEAVAESIAIGSSHLDLAPFRVR